MRIIYFKATNSTFVLKDEEILKRSFYTTSFLINTKSAFKYFFSLIKLILFLIFKGWSVDLYFIRFADWHTAIIAFFKKLFRKKLIIVIGGFDVAAISEINYGVHLNKRRSRWAKYAMRHADVLLPNSKSLVEYSNYFIQSPPVKGGINYFCPKTQANIKVVPNGFNPDFWRKKNLIKKENLAVTVAYVSSDRTFYLKGIDKFIEVAKSLPDYRFLIVGITDNYIKTSNIKLPANLKAIESIQPNQLVDIYSRARVFCLFSLSEGMPNVLCEAMLCECIPVGTNVTSIPEIIDGVGVLIQSRSVEEHTTSVKKAFDLDRSFALKARQNIAEKYNITKREEDIISIINQL